MKQFLLSINSICYFASSVS